MRIGIIDLGTNSVRFDVHEIHPRGRLIRLHREKLMIRLGQGVFLTGRLDNLAKDRAFSAFKSFLSTARDLRVDRILAFGTASLREAADSQNFVDQVRKKFGIELRVITGQEEARLIARGILTYSKCPKGTYALVDIGGGSTEISICKGQKILFSTSFNLGAARLQQVFLKRSPPKNPSNGHGKSMSPIEQLREHIRSTFVPDSKLKRWPKVETIIGSSGTIKALGKIVRLTENDAKLTRKRLRKLVKKMSTMTTTQLLGLPGMEAKRVDMILAGAVLLDEIMDCLKAKKVEPTSFELRDGLLLEGVRLTQSRAQTNLPFHIDDIVNKAKQLGVYELHSQHVVEICVTLFDRLARLHKLSSAWKHHLVAAALLHDVGESVSKINHARHGAYIVRQADFPHMDPWERILLEHLVLHHADTQGVEGKMPFAHGSKLRSVFLRLLAILRVADALDRNRSAVCKVTRVRIQPKEVHIILKTKGSATLEQLRVEQKKHLFEQLFRKTLLVSKA